MLLLLVDPDAGLVARDATWGERLTARLRARKLDREIASGACPDSDAVLTLRALVLVGPQMRYDLAGRVTKLLEDASAPARRPSRARVAVRSTEVAAAEVALRRLVCRLITPGPVSAQGVAAMHVMLTDGAGPLYHPGSPVGVREAVEKILLTLGPADNWE